MSNLQRIQRVFKSKEIDYNQWGGYELFEGKKHVKDKKGKAPKANKGASNETSALYDISKLENEWSDLWIERMSNANMRLVWDLIDSPNISEKKLNKINKKLYEIESF